MEHLNLISQLEANLAEQNDLYTNLYQLLKTESDYLSQSDLENINKAAALKEALLKEATRKEEERLSICTRLKPLLSIHSDEAPRLLEIAVKVPEPHKKRLISYKRDFEALLAEIQTQNKDNSQLADSALKTLNGTMDVVKTALQGGKTYQAKGKIDNKKEQQSHLLVKSV